MAFQATYPADAPEREKVDRMPGLVLLEFGVDWCPHCQGAQAAIETALRASPQVTHIKVEDGPGRPLGRSFRVKLWPTLVLMRDGQEIGRQVRPTSEREVVELLVKALP